MEHVIYTCKQTFGSNAVSSLLFRDEGIPSGMASPVSNSDILITGMAFAGITALYFSALASRIKSGMSATSTVFTAFANIFLIPSVNQFDTYLFGTPKLAFAVPNILEEQRHRLEQFGYRLKGNGRRQYWYGPAPTQPVLDQILNMAPEMDTFVPHIYMNLNGFLAYKTVNRLVMAYVKTSVPPHKILGNAKGGKIRFLPGASDNEQKTLGIINLATYKSPRWEDPLIRNTDDLDMQSKGIFFKYFPGLTLPDLSVTTDFINHMTPCLGNSPEAAISMATVLLQSVRQILHSPEGLAMQHAMFGLLQAEKAMAELNLVLVNNEYRGFTLQAPGLTVNQRGKITKASKTNLVDAIKTVMTHESSLSKISDILSSIYLDDKEKDKHTAVVTKESLTSPRGLHYAFRERNISAENMKELKPLIKSLAYPGQQYWDVTDLTKIREAIAAIAGATSINKDAPFPYLSYAILLSKDPIVSILAAFGTTAPSIRIKGGTLFHILPLASSKTQEIEPDAAGRVKLPGIAIYQDSVISAAAQWKDVMTEHALSYKMSASYNYIGAAKVVSAKKAGPLLEDIKNYFGASIREDGKKLKRKEPDTPAEIRIAKRARRTEVSSQLAMLLGTHAYTADVEMAGDEDDDDVERDEA